MIGIIPMHMGMTHYNGSYPSHTMMGMIIPNIPIPMGHTHRNHDGYDTHHDPCDTHDGYDRYPSLPWVPFVPMMGMIPIITNISWYAMGNHAYDGNHDGYHTHHA